MSSNPKTPADTGCLLKPPIFKLILFSQGPKVDTLRFLLASCATPLEAARIERPVKHDEQVNPVEIQESEMISCDRATIRQLQCAGSNRQ